MNIMDIQPKLGLGPSPDQVVYLFVGEAEGDEGPTAWYEFDFAGQHKIPVKDNAVTGYINNVTIVKKEFKRQTNYKLDIHIQADRKYVVRTGAGTTFGRGFLLSLSQIVDHYGLTVLDEPLTISVTAGQEKAAFCSIWVNGKKFIPQWDGEVQLFPIVKQLQEDLGQVVQTKEMIDDPQLYWDAVKGKRESEEKNEQPKSSKHPRGHR